MQFELSVIVPVYNAGQYIPRAVESALQFNFVKEVLLIEDGSKDNSLAVCKAVQLQYNDRVRLIQHKDGANLGAAESRNVGIRNAKSNFLSFLDADDYYLPNRFRNDIRIFEKYKDADGAFNALGVSFENEEVKEKFLSQGFPQITTVSHELLPHEVKDVFLGLHDYKRGYIHLDTLTLKRESLKNVPMFNPGLRLHQDTEWLIKLSFLLKLYSSEIVNPVAIRSVHPQNRVTRFTTHQTRAKMYKELFQWMLNLSIDEKYCRIVKYKFINYSLLAEDSRYKRLMLGLNFIMSRNAFISARVLKLILHRFIFLSR